MIKAVIFDMYETLITHYDCPLYFGSNMAEDAGIAPDDFLPMWRGSESDRFVGRETLEGILEKIMRANGKFDPMLLEKIVKKRISCKEELFKHLNPEIIPMLEGIKEKGLKIGLITNCFSEESDVIKRSVLYKYFDETCISFDEGLEKPDPEIFYRCARKLGVNPDECLYVGDGGSHELEGADAVGMHPLQAMWYYRGEWTQTDKKGDFRQAYSPLEVLKNL